MGMSKYPSCVSMPCVEQPYPSILDFLAQRFPHIGPGLWKQRILEGKVLDERKGPVSLDTPYVPRQKLFYFRETEEEPRIPLEEKILFQNEEILVVCKPPFLPVIPSGPYINECLLNRLKLKTGNSNLAPLHRIDRETSGIVLFSMNKETRGVYGRLFSTGSIEKTYEALSAVTHCPQASNWIVENRLVRGDPWFRSKTAPGIANAHSGIKMVGFRNDRAHFLLYPVTGKKHQLRVHMSGLGFRIMNDRYYPELLPQQEDDLDNPLQLIARRMNFTDPISGKKMEFESERKLLF